ncbi:MAG: hypothetical protein FJ276_22275, partial [Planctomycetes bacterium]|nr:hypothetical protein [Planctomycetota bacterium]
VLENLQVVASGPALRFRDNYFTLNGRPMFLFGTDTYARLYKSASENPWTWNEELARARDVGVNLYENLQYQRPGHVMRDDDWRAFQAVAQLTQTHQLVFMPGMLIGHNVAVGPELLSEQSELCRQYARHLRHVPGLLYYINGDYQLRTDEHPEAVRREWTGWLRGRYTSMELLQDAWRSDAAAADFGEVEFPPPDTGHWDDVAKIDYVRFLMKLTTRWNDRHVTTIRHVDTRHPITSEYYARPFDGIDLPLTIGWQDVANIGYFDRPEVDIDRLPLSISFHDLRVRGKGVSLGEYGVKTHPAWSIENGATGYHIRRSEEQQKQLFMAVAHYGLGLGCSKIQNWCLRDGQAWVFPWGMFYPNQLVPKDVAWVHRNQSLLWRCFTPRYDPPALVVCQANHLRLGNNSVLGPELFDRAVADLLAAHLPFGCVDDGHLERLSAATKVLIYPAPFAVDDAAFGALVSWVERGGTLLVTGDVSYDENRQATRAERLTYLAGVRLTDRRCPHVLRHLSGEVAAEFTLGGGFHGTLRPCVRVEPAGGEVVGRDAGGEPVMVRHRLGRGTVFYLTDPLELGGEPRDAELRRRIYGAVAATCGVTPHDVSPDVPWLHVMVQPTAQGRVHVVFNTRPGTGSQTVRLSTAAGQVDLTTRDRWPSLVAATASGDVVVVNAFGSAAVDGQALLDGAGQAAILSLDRQDLRRSQAVLIAPFEPGRIVLPARDGDYVAVVGEFVNGQWTAWESLTLPRERWDIELDEDRATALVLVCLREEQARWASHLTGMLCRPDRIEGF